MEKFNINKIIEHYKLDTDELAKVLFPYIKYPKQAFDRILRGEANLDTAQVENLASYIGVMVYDLYTLDEWRGTREDSCLTFIKGEYKVKINYDGAFMTILKNGEVVRQQIASHGGMTISSFITYINNLTKND